MEHNRLYLNETTFVTLVAQSDLEVSLLDPEDKESFEDRSSLEDNPMGLTFVGIEQGYAEEGYGVVDLYVFKDIHHQLWGTRMYRGLGKHDYSHEFYNRLENSLSHTLDGESSDDPDSVELRALKQKKITVFEEV